MVSRPRHGFWVYRWDKGLHEGHILTGLNRADSRSTEGLWGCVCHREKVTIPRNEQEGGSHTARKTYT